MALLLHVVEPIDGIYRRIGLGIGRFKWESDEGFAYRRPKGDESCLPCCKYGEKVTHIKC